MKKKIILILIGIIVGIPLAIILTNYYKLEAVKVEDKFIAHAGGEIDNAIYTNCLEAVELSIKKGYKYIELDLLLTNDNMIIAGHDWAYFNRLTGLDTIGDKRPSHGEAMERKINGNLTPLDAKHIVDIFKRNPDVILVTDKLDNTEMLNQYFSEIKEQMLVESFSINAYFELKDAGFIPMLSGLAPSYSGLDNYIYGWLLSPSNWSKGSVDWIVSRIPSEKKYKNFMRANRLLGINMAIFTINDYNACKDLNNNVSLIYTDNLLH